MAAEEAELAAVAFHGHLGAAACHGHLAVVWRDRPAVAYHAHPEVQCLVRPADRGHRSAVPLHSIVPAAAHRARQVRQRDRAWVPEAVHDLRFSLEPAPALVSDRDWRGGQARDPGHRLCQPIVLVLELVPGRVWDLDHRLFQPLVRVLDWQRAAEMERESPIDRETRFLALEVRTQDQGFRIRVLEFRIAWQIAHRRSKTDGAA